MNADRDIQKPDRSERNLLFGWLALQSKVISLDELLAATQNAPDHTTWLLEESLVRAGKLSEEDREGVAKLCETVRRSPALEYDATRSFVPGDFDDEPTSAGDESTNLMATTAAPQGRGNRPRESHSVRDRYDKTRMHAQGGIGRVWFAHDRLLDRDIALKELRPERVQNTLHVERFVGEAKITGQLQHPAIVPVYELVESEEDHPFYTMRFFHGKTLHEAVEDFHPHWRSGEAGELELRDLVQSLAVVANAVAYAHSKGVIHRDLKGQNIVIGDFGEVIVLDWGIAKRLGVDKSNDASNTEAAAPETVDDAGDSATLEGQVIGTPAFMAPEQAAGRIGDIDQRTDVYGLGAVLYQILTNQPPFKAKPATALLDKVINERPRPPREVCPRVPKALEAICLKALEKNPADRYATASDLVDDIRRYVADEPVSAYPEPILTRCGRWARRHRTAVAATTVLLITAVVALSTSTWLIAREQQRTEQQRQLASEYADRAETSYEKALKAVDTMLTKVADERLQDVPHMSMIRRDLLKEALQLNEQLLAEQPDDQRGKVEVARANSRIAKLYSYTGDGELALQRYQESIDLYSELAEQDTKYLVPIANNLFEMAYVHNESSEFKEGEACCHLGIELLAPLLKGAKSVDEKVTDDARLVEVRINRILGNMLIAQGQIADGESRLQRALDGLRPPREADPSLYLDIAAGCHTGIGNLYAMTGRGGQAKAEYEKARELLDSLLDVDPDSNIHLWGLAHCYRALAQLAASEGNSDRSEEMLNRALDVRRRLARDFSYMPDYRLEYAMILNDIGVRHARGGDIELAEDYFRQALDEDKEAVAAFPNIARLRMNLGYDYNNVGTLLLQTGRMNESLEMHKQALQVRKELTEQFPQEPQFRADMASSINNVGVLFQRLGQPELAAEQYAEAIRLRTQLAADSPQITRFQHKLAETHRVRGSLLSSQDRFEEALADLKLAQQIYEQLPEGTVELAQSRWRLAETHQMIGDTYKASDRPGQATESYREALRIREGVIARHSGRTDFQVELAANYRVLGEHLRETGELDMATDQFQKSIAILNNLSQEMRDNPQINIHQANGLRGLAAIAAEDGDFDKASAHIHQALEFDEEAIAASPDNAEFIRSLRADRYWKASILAMKGSLEEATRIADELVAGDGADEDDHYEAARIHARCVRAVRQSEDLSAELRSMTVASHTRQIIELLNRARELDPNIQIDQDDFAELADHPEIQKLLNASAIQND